MLQPPGKPRENRRKPTKLAEIGVRGGAVRQMRTSLCFPYPTAVSGGEKAAPLGESSGAGQLVGVAVLKVALRRKVVVD